MSRPINKCEYECLLYLREGMASYNDPLLKLSLDEITIIEGEGNSYEYPITTWTEKEMRDFRRMGREGIYS